MSDKSITQLPSAYADQPNPNHENLVKDVQGIVSLPTTVAGMATDKLNYGVGMLTDGISRALPCFPAARLFGDLVFGWPHMHVHPPNLVPPAPPIFLPSIGPVILAGALNVLINGLPAARCGDVGFGAWCGGFYPLFEVFTGSSNVFIGGSRASRMLIDFTRHCLPSFLSGKKGVKDAEEGLKGISKLGKLKMFGIPAGKGALGIGSSLIDMANDNQDAANAQSASLAAAYSAAAEAEAIDAAMTALQTAASLAAMALSVGMGKDPGTPPFLCLGNFITGSFNVLIGGLPLPDWSVFKAGLKKMLKPWAEKKQAKLPAGSWRSRALCWITGHPVDIASGRVFTSQTDFELPGRIPIVFTRNYDSSATDYEGPLGRGWTHPYDIHLWEDEAQEMVILRTEEGMVVGFELLEVGEKAFNPLEKLWLERLDDEVYVVHGKDGVRYKFAPLKDHDLAIAGIDEVDGVDSLGKSEATALRLNEIEDRNGNKIRLFYEQWRLAWLDDDAGTRVNFYYITLDNGMVRLAAINQTIDKDSARTAKLVNFTYDLEGRLTNATDRGLIPWRYTYDKYLLIRETNRNGLNFHFDYRGEGREARCVHTWGDGGIYERWLDYDREMKITVVENSLKAKTTYYFNDLFLPVRIVDALGGERQFIYGAGGELLSEIDEIGRETKYLYNAQFDCISIAHPDGTVRRFEYNSDQLLEKLIDEAGAQSRREYDERGNITATIDALGHRCEYSYHRFGDIEKVIDPLGGVTKLKWNERRQIKEIITPLGAKTRYSYDESGRLVSVIDPLGRATRYDYNTLGQLVQMQRPDGTRHHYKYDPEGNLTNFIDANGMETRFRYLNYNKLGERIDALGYSRRFVYNTEANLVAVHNERDEAYRFTYDALGRMTREVCFDGLTLEYVYDPADQLIARTDPAGRVTRFIRDLKGRVIEKQRPDGSAINFSYDKVDRLIEADAPGSELEFTYDALGHIVQELQNGRVIEHEYDALGRRIKRHSSSGQTVKFSYDADSLLSRLETPRGSIEFVYDKAGQITKRRLPSGLDEEFYYDRCRRMIEQSLHQSGRILFNRRYKYDAEGNLIELNDSNKGLSRFEYDPVERLREVMQPVRGSEQFVYDSTGNLSRRGARTFRYAQTDRLTQTEDATLVYDEVGNLIEKRLAGSVIHYDFDPDNRLISVESKEGGLVEFSYDAFGRRIAKKTKDGETGFLWDGDVLLGEQFVDQSNEYIFALEGYEPLCRFDQHSFQTFHNDHLGTPQELTDERGQVVWSAGYDVYGHLNLLYEDRSENQIRFQGQYEDVETGLFYNFYRYYDPETGRYISKDPIRLRGDLNQYEYTFNPVNWVDPLGLMPLSGQDFTGSPDLFPVKEGQRNIVQIKMQGRRTRDFTQAFKEAGISKTDATGYTWHHVDDFDPNTGTTTMQLVKRSTHEATFPHKGSVAQFEAHFDVEYDTHEAVEKSHEKGWLEGRTPRNCGCGQEST